jgi:hypothetical protein
VPDATGDLHPVALDLHPSAAAVAELAPVQVPVQRGAVEQKAGGQALHDAGQTRAVGLACGCQSERHRAL